MGAPEEVDRLGAESRAGVLLTHHYTSLLRTARGTLFTDVGWQAEDLVCDLIGDVATGKLARLPADRKRLVPFCHGVLRNRAKDVNRRERRLVALADAPPATDRSPDPLHRTEWVLLRSEVGHALRCLAPRERECAILHWIEGWGTPEVAGHLEIATSTAKELLRRGRKKLRRSLTLPDDHRASSQ